MQKILVLGTVGREKVHSEGKTSPIVFGGTGYYATEAILKATTTEPLLVSTLGYDLETEDVIGQFSRRIPVTGIVRNTERPSFFWEARYESGLRESSTLTLENRILEDFKPDWAGLRQEYCGIKWCYVAAFDPKVQQDCCRYFNNSFIVVETLKYWIERDKREVLDAIRHANGVVVTEAEFFALWELEAPPNTTHQRILPIVDEYELDFLVVTFAERGSQVFDKNGTFFAPALSCDTIDSTGAGNAFSGGIVAHLSMFERYERGQLPRAVALGTALAGIQVQDFSNHALRRATPERVRDLQEAIIGSVGGWRPPNP